MNRIGTWTIYFLKRHICVWPKRNHKGQLISKIAGDATATNSGWIQLSHGKFHTWMPAELISGCLHLSRMLLLGLNQRAYARVSHYVKRMAWLDKQTSGHIFSHLFPVFEQAMNVFSPGCCPPHMKGTLLLGLPSLLE